MEQISGDGMRREVEPGMLAQFDQMETHFSNLTERFMTLRQQMKEAALAEDSEAIGILTGEMDALVKAEWPDAKGPEINYIMFLLHLIDQAKVWTDHNFETMDTLLRLMGPLLRPDHPLFGMPGFSREQLDEELAATLDVLSRFDDNDGTFTTATGVILYNLHQGAACAGTFCVVHNPAPGPWDTWDTHWREDWRLMVRICPHDVHHVAIEEMLRMPLLGMIGHDHPEGCNCACDLSKCSAVTGVGGNITGFIANT